MSIRTAWGWRAFIPSRSRKPRCTRWRSSRDRPSIRSSARWKRSRARKMPPSNNIMLSRELQVTLQLAVTEAVNRRHEYVCLEHLLYAMLHDVTTSNILQNSGSDLEELKKKLARYLDEQVERMPKGETVMPRYAIGVQRALQRAALHVQSSG